MFIVNQNRTSVWNLDNFENISLDGDNICISCEMRTYVLGHYTDDNRAGEVFRQILSDLFGMVSTEPDEEKSSAWVELGCRQHTPVVMITRAGEPSVEAMPYSVWFMPEN